MRFFVFSYNRGPHLENCIRSIEACAPGSKIDIYDDNSSDRETVEILDKLNKSHDVHQPSSNNTLGQHGGLYHNMQSAIDSIPEKDNQVICFLQDDTQLVRKIEQCDLDFISNYFDDNKTAGFLAPVFQKNITRAKTMKRFSYNSQNQVFQWEDNNRKAVAGVYYSDISITTGERLRNVGWSFSCDEYENELQAKKHFMKMGYLCAPFAMWLPNPPAYRNKKKSITFRLAEKINKAGLYPFNYMSSEKVTKLRAMSDIPAIDEEHLQVSDKTLTSPWIYHPLRRSRVLRKMEKLESLIRSLWKK